MNNPNQAINTIYLPSFIRRTLKPHELKVYIRQLGCDLHRLGRSRNWELKANFIQLKAIVDFIEHRNEISWFWLAKLLRSKYQCLNHQSLLLIAKGIEELTIAGLMAQTDCSLAQARRILDEIEDLD
jgi:hypothetical protein